MAKKRNDFNPNSECSTCCRERCLYRQFVPSMAILLHLQVLVSISVSHRLDPIISVLPTQFHRLSPTKTDDHRRHDRMRIVPQNAAHCRAVRAVVAVSGAALAHSHFEVLTIALRVFMRLFHGRQSFGRFHCGFSVSSSARSLPVNK